MVSGYGSSRPLCHPGTLVSVGTVDGACLLDMAPLLLPLCPLKAGAQCCAFCAHATDHSGNRMVHQDGGPPWVPAWLPLSRLQVIRDHQKLPRNPVLFSQCAQSSGRVRCFSVYLLGSLLYFYLFVVRKELSTKPKLSLNS